MHHLPELRVKDWVVPDSSFWWGTGPGPHIKMPVSDPNKLWCPFPGKSEGRWVFRAGFPTPARALGGAHKPTLIPPCPQVSCRRSLLSEPTALTGHVGSVLLPVCFYFARFPPTAGQFCFLGSRTHTGSAELPWESVILVFTCPGGDKSSTDPLELTGDGRCWDRVFFATFLTKLWLQAHLLWYSTEVLSFQRY